MRRLSLAISSVLIALSVSASEGYTASYELCITKAEGETSGLANCSNEELSRQDARLNKAYKTAISVISTENKQKLLSSQRIWIKFRDADCGIYYSLTGGTMDILNGSGCELSMTRERAEALEWMSQNGGE